MPQVTATISSGASISGGVDVSQGRIVAIHIPTITSADLLVRGAWDGASGSHTRLQKILPNTGDMRFAAGVGSNTVLWALDTPHPPFIRLETGVAQADNRTFVLTLTPWGVAFAN